MADQWHHHRVPELLVGAGIGDGNLELVGISHQPGALPRGQSPGIPGVTATDEDLRSVFVVACRKGSRNIVLTEDAAAETVTFGAVLFGIGLEIVPKLVAQDILFEDFPARIEIPAPIGIGLRPGFAMQYGAQTGRIRAVRQRHGVPVELRGLAEAHNQNSFAMLRDEVSAVDNPDRNAVAKLIFENVPDYRKSVPAIVREQVLDIFEKERAGPLAGEDSGDIEEKRALRLAFEAMRPAKCILLGYAGEAERLAGKPGQQNVVVRNLAGRDFGDIARYRVLVIGKVRAVRPVAVGVPFAGEDTFS